MGIGYVYFKLNSMYDKEEAKQINTTIEESEKNKKNGIEYGICMSVCNGRF